MIPVPGHLASGIILSKVFRLNISVVLIATFMPDLFDKPLRYVFHIFPFGRNVLHSISGLCLVSLIVFIFWGKKTGLSWAVGHGGHILCDAIGDIVAADRIYIPWFWPFITYTFPHVSGFKVNYCELTVEIIISIIAFFMIWPWLKKVPAKFYKIQIRKK